MNTLKDSFGRSFPYIRLSITDVCNFKCGYCLPNGYQVDKSDNRTFLSALRKVRLSLLSTWYPFGKQYPHLKLQTSVIDNLM